MGADNGRGWVCLVCGYVHRGTAPPENCPVCGAARTDFEPYEAPSPTPSRPEPELWRCLICNYTHAGPEPPANCPVCGALANDFEPGEEAEKDLAGRGEGGKVFVVGGGIAGVSAVEALRQASPSADITLVSKEPGLPYYRLNLTRFLAGEIGEDALPIHPAQWYEEQRIRLVPDTEVTAILPGERFIETDNEGGETFDKVVLACGAHPLIPPIPGASREGVTALRTRAQAKALLARVTPDVLVYNAGIAKDNLFAFMTKDEWDSVIRTNLDGFYNVVQPVVFGMLAAKRGRIVVISSTSGQIGQAGQVNYSASKAGLIGAVKALAREVGRKQIYVNVVSPGVIDTEMTKDLPKDKILPLIPLARFGTCEETAAVVDFLCSEPAMYIHGQVIGVNGGLAI